MNPIKYYPAYTARRLQPDALSTLSAKRQSQLMQLPLEMDDLQNAPLVREWAGIECIHIEAPYPPDWPGWHLNIAGGLIRITRARLVRRIVAWLWWEERAQKLGYRRPPSPGLAHKLRPIRSSA